MTPGRIDMAQVDVIFSSDGVSDAVRLGRLPETG